MRVIVKLKKGYTGSGVSLFFEYKMLIMSIMSIVLIRTGFQERVLYIDESTS